MKKRKNLTYFICNFYTGKMLTKSIVLGKKDKNGYDAQNNWSK